MICVFCKSPFLVEGYQRICPICEHCECEPDADRLCRLHLALSGGGHHDPVSHEMAKT